MSEEICLICGKLSTPHKSLQGTDRHMCLDCSVAFNASKLRGVDFIISKLIERIEALENETKRVQGG
jgi:hypothetical protein